MSSRPPLLNENHRKVIYGGVQYVDHLLSTAVLNLSVCDPGEISHPVVIDIAPEQREGIADHVARLRGAMRNLLAACGIPVEPPTASGLWSLCCNLSYVQVALEEMDARHLLGYGEMDAEAAAFLDAELEKVMRTLAEFMIYAEACSRRARPRANVKVVASPSEKQRPSPP